MENLEKQTNPKPNRIIILGETNEVSIIDKQMLSGYRDLEKHSKVFRTKIISQANEMLEILDTLENDNGEIPVFLWERIQKVLRFIYPERYVAPKIIENL